MPLRDKLRAAVFARDKGICAFSGLSLWLLDYGTAPFGQADWPDHVVPVSRGGKGTVDNLVCASHFHNRKKLNNGSDRIYLFRNGRPTEDFFWEYGELSEAQAVMLRRHACLTEADWYFNRALFNIRVALANDASGVDVMRDQAYWLRSARKRLVAWQKITGGAPAESFIDRGLVRYPSAPDVQLMLSLTDADENRLSTVYKLLSRHYWANWKTLDRFSRARSDHARVVALASARESGLVTEPLMSALERGHAGLIGLR